MKLVAKQGIVAGLEFALDKAVVVIGRDAAADVAIPDGKASRRHAEIHMVGGGLSILDLSSANGTFVNGLRIFGKRTLRPGDEIGIGDVVFSVQEGLARAAPPLPVFAADDQGQLEVGAPRRSSWVWALAGVIILIVVAVVVGGLVALRGGLRISGLGVTNRPTATTSLTPQSIGTSTPPAVVVVATKPTLSSEAAAQTATVRATLAGSSGGQPAQSGTPSSQTPPFTVGWSAGRYEGWADGRRMSSDLAIENISLPQIAPPYSPYFIISDANGAMRVGELRDYSSANNPLPTLLPGQRVVWTWFTTMTNQEWVRGSVFRYGGWSWAQEFNPDGSLNGRPRAISDQQLIPFLPVKVSPEELPTVLPELIPSLVPTGAP